MSDAGFDFALFAMLVAAAIPGVAIAIPRQVRRTLERIGRRPGPGGRTPSQAALSAIGIAQYLGMIAIAAAVGTALAPRAGLTAPAFESLVSGQPLPVGYSAQLVRSGVISAAAAIPFLVLYYGIVRPRLDPQVVRITEGDRLGLGFAGRILYGGIVEEILFRWGVMSPLVWIGGSLFGRPSSTAFWIAIIVSGLLFGLGHLPSLSNSGVQLNRRLVASSLSLNLYGAVVFGWLFWQYGLLAAMLSHALFHVIWFPFDRLAYQRAWPT